ncbi:MAG: hypothetical protein Q7R92_01735 [bacterium]|nr:hypothetical protein [bacterium]
MIFSSPMEFDVYNITSNKKLMTAEKIPSEAGPVVYIFEASINLFSRAQYAFKDIDECWYKIDPEKISDSPSHYRIQEQGFERICGDWWATTNITAENGIFPSEVTELFKGDTIKALIESPFWIDYDAPPDHLRTNGDWELVRVANGKIMARYANPLPSSALLKESDKGINEFTTKINKLVNTIVATRKAGLITPDSATLYTAFVNTIIQYRDLAEWVDEAPGDGVTNLLELAKPLAKLVAEMVDTGLLSRYLLSLDWKKDITIVDPRWYDNWSRVVSINGDKRSPFFANLSFRDVQVRLFWQRRGQVVFETVRQTVKDELAKK